MLSTPVRFDKARPELIASEHHYRAIRDSSLELAEILLNRYDNSTVIRVENGENKFFHRESDGQCGFDRKLDAVPRPPKRSDTQFSAGGGTRSSGGSPCGGKQQLQQLTILLDALPPSP